MNKETEQQHLQRERATYQYLDALEAGDIDRIIDVLQHATYDASLGQSVFEAHQAYFREEQAPQASVIEADADTKMVAMTQNTLRSGITKERRTRSSAVLWVQVLAATLIVVVLVGGLVRFLSIMHPTASVGNSGVTATVPRPTATASLPTPTPIPTSVSSCTSFSWQVAQVQTHGQLASVAVLSSTDVWAVGNNGGNGFNTLPLIEHWNGQQWSVVSSPVPPDSAGYLSAVVALAPDDVWAVGNQVKPAKAVDEIDIGHTLIEHWNGHQWSIVTSPVRVEGPNINNILESITAVSANDIWAVGETAAYVQNTLQTLIEHWDGQTWSIVPDTVSQNATIRSSLGEVVVVPGTSGRQILSGGSRSGSDQVYHAMLERWDGQHWSEVNVTQLGPSNAIVSLSALSQNDIWAVVRYNSSTGNGGNYNRIAHFNGQKWSVPSLPGWMTRTDTNNVNSILAVASNNVWTFGGAMINGHIRPLIAHWNGTSWSQLPTQISSSDATTDFIVFDIAISDNIIWIVGSLVTNNGGGLPVSPLIGQGKDCK